MSWYVFYLINPSTNLPEQAEPPSYPTYGMTHPIPVMLPEEREPYAPPIIPDPNEGEENDPYTLEFDGTHEGPPIYAEQPNDPWRFVNPDSRAAAMLQPSDDDVWTPRRVASGVLRPFDGYPDSAVREPEVIDAEFTPPREAIPVTASFPIKECACGTGSSCCVRRSPEGEA